MALGVGVGVGVQQVTAAHAVYGRDDKLEKIELWVVLGARGEQGTQRVWSILYHTPELIIRGDGVMECIIPREKKY